MKNINRTLFIHPFLYQVCRRNFTDFSFSSVSSRWILFHCLDFGQYIFFGETSASTHLEYSTFELVGTATSSLILTTLFLFLF